MYTFLSIYFISLKENEKLASPLFCLVIEYRRVGIKTLSWHFTASDTLISDSDILKLQPALC